MPVVGPVIMWIMPKKKKRSLLGIQKVNIAIPFEKEMLSSVIAACSHCFVT